MLVLHSQRNGTAHTARNHHHRQRSGQHSNDARTPAPSDGRTRARLP